MGFFMWGGIVMCLAIGMEGWELNARNLLVFGKVGWRRF